MGLFNTLKQAGQVLRKMAGTAKLTRALETELNARGMQVSFSHEYHITGCEFGGMNRLEGKGSVHECKIGAFTYIQNGCNIAHADIGPFCSIGPNNTVAQGEHPVDHISTHPAFTDDSSPWQKTIQPGGDHAYHRRVHIGADVWIGGGCYIRDGVRIGHGAVIAAGSVVVKDVGAYAIVGGTPAGEIRKRFDAGIVRALLDSRWWELDAGQLAQLSVHFQKPLDQGGVADFLNAVKGNR